MARCNVLGGSQEQPHMLKEHREGIGCFYLSFPFFFLPCPLHIDQGSEQKEELCGALLGGDVDAAAFQGWSE